MHEAWVSAVRYFESREGIDPNAMVAKLDPPKRVVKEKRQYKTRHRIGRMLGAQASLLGGATPGSSFGEEDGDED
jgi:hypothetical protein